MDLLGKVFTIAVFHGRFIAALFTIAKIWKQPKCPSVDEWIKQLGHLHNGIVFGHKKEENFTLCNGIDGHGEHYAK